MLFYFLPIFFTYILSFFKIGRLNKNGIPVKWSIYLLAIIIFCFGYMTGSDWRSYEPDYDSVLINDWSNSRYEKGFFLLMIVFKFFGVSFFPFLFACKIFSFLTFAKFFERFSTNHYLALAIFLSTNALFLLVDNPLRFMLALSIVLIAYSRLLNKKYWGYILLILLAASFHISAVILLPLVFIKEGRLFRKPVLMYVAYFLLWFLLTPEIMGALLKPVLLRFLSLDFYYHKLVAQQGFSMFTVGITVHVFLFVLTVLNRDYICGITKYGKDIYNYTVLYFFASIICNPIPTFFRFSLYLAPFSYIAFSLVMLKYMQSYKTIILTCFMLCYFLLSTSSRIAGTWVYLPYSNYLVYLFRDKPSFSKRDSYNIIKYHQRTGKWPEGYGLPQN